MSNGNDKSPMGVFIPQSYWETRLKSRPNLRGTGHRQFSTEYNEAMYRVASERLKSALDLVHVDLTGKRVLDVGPGLGYFVQRYIDWGAAHVTGLDITQISVQILSRAFPQHTFVQGDISSEILPLVGGYDVVSAIHVIYHIIDDCKFEKAIENMCMYVSQGGHLILVDSYRGSLLPTARHTRLRNLNDYISILNQYGFSILDIRPMYYVMGRSFIPMIGPRLLSLRPMLNFLLRLEYWLGGRLKSNLDGLKVLIAKHEYNCVTKGTRA
jgi:SAM-dependent methyltransferase